MGELWRRLRYLLNRRQMDEELQNDMDFHREMAARAGGGQFGDTLRLREDSREAWGWMWMDRLGQDLRYAGRMLRKSPGFTLAAVLMLGIGIGVNVAAFSFFNLMVLSPLPVRDPFNLLRFHRHSPQAYAFALPYPEMTYLREHSRTLSAVLAENTTRIPMEGEPKPLNGHFVTANFFAELGAPMLMGRAFDPSGEEREPVIVLLEGFWRRHFGGDFGAVGRVFLLNGKSVTVIGVASKAFSGLSMDKPDFWAPLERQPYLASGSTLLTSYESSGVTMFGRLRAGMNPTAAEEELRGLAAELRKTHPKDIWENETLPAEPGGYAKSLMIGNRSGTGREDRGELFPVVALIVSLCLLILAVACGNLGSLLLARGVAREREMSIRVSVGAGRARLVRQLFTESVVLGLLGAMAGVGLGSAVLRGLIVVSGSPEWLDASPDWRVVVFAVVAGFISAILFGLTPATQVVRQKHRSTRVRQVLVGAQVAASCVLLIVSGLLVRALEHATSMDPGFEFQRVIAIDPGLGTHGYSPARARAYLNTLRQRLGELPGVEAVAMTDTAPLGNHVSSAHVEVDGRSTDILLNHVDENFLGAMKIRMVQGRGLARGDVNSIVIGQRMAARLWPGENPLGKYFSVDGADSTVVGIAASARLVKPEDSDLTELYAPAKEADLPSMGVVVRTAGSPRDVARAAVAIARSIDPEIFPAVDLLQDAYLRKLETARSGVMAVSLLGFTAQLLACLGIVGVVAYAVSQRVREIGIRMALGAKAVDIVVVVLRQFAWPVAMGLAAGVGGAAALSGLMRQALYGISNLDPVAYLAAILFFVVTVGLAALLPARRALRVDPMRALRQD